MTEKKKKTHSLTDEEKVKQLRQTNVIRAIFGSLVIHIERDASKTF